MSRSTTSVQEGLEPDRRHFGLVESFAMLGLAAGSALVVAITTDSRPLTAMAAMVPVVLLGMSKPRFIRRLLLLVVAAEIPLQIDRYIGHDIREAAWQSVSGFNVSLTTFAIVGLFWLLILERASGSARLTRPPATIMVPAVLYLAASIASLVVATDPRMSAYEIVILVQAFLIFLYVSLAVRSREDILLILIGIAGAVVIEGLLAALLSVGPSKLDFGIVSATREGTRVGGTFHSPNALGGYLVLALPPMVGLTLGAPRPFARLAGGVAAAAGGLTLLLTSSRGAWIGSFVGLTFALWLARRRRWISTAALVVALSVALVVGASMADRIIARVTAFDNEAALSRLPLMELAVDMSLDHPVLGVGPNNFATVVPEYLTTEFSRSWISTVHNKYLLVLSETGILGLATFLWLLFAALFLAYRWSRARDPALAAASAGLASGLAGFMVHMTVDIFNSRPHVQMLWLVFGLVAAISTTARQDDAQAPVAADAPGPTAEGR